MLHSHLISVTVINFSNTALEPTQNLLSELETFD
jgi:hypothetical protein